MLDKLYSNKSEKDLKAMLNLYRALLIVAVSLLIVFNGLSYFLSGKFHFGPTILLIVVIFWSALNNDYLKKELSK